MNMFGRDSMSCSLALNTKYHKVEDNAQNIIPFCIHSIICNMVENTRVDIYEYLFRNIFMRVGLMKA